MSHSFGRGSAIFEVIGFHDTPAGPAVFRLDEYLSRFWKSASLLEMEPPLTQGALQEAVLKLVKRSGMKSGFLKMYGFYPEISFQILPPAEISGGRLSVFRGRGARSAVGSAPRGRDRLRLAVAAARPPDRSDRSEGGGQLCQRDGGPDGVAGEGVRLCHPARYTGIYHRGGDRDRSSWSATAGS